MLWTQTNSKYQINNHFKSVFLLSGAFIGIAFLIPQKDCVAFFPSQPVYEPFLTLASSFPKENTIPIIPNKLLLPQGIKKVPISLIPMSVLLTLHSFASLRQPKLCSHVRHLEHKFPLVLSPVQLNHC